MKNLLKRPLRLAMIPILISISLYRCGPGTNNTPELKITRFPDDKCGTATDETTVAKMLNAMTVTTTKIGNQALFICRADLETMLAETRCNGIFVAYGEDVSDTVSTLAGMTWQSMESEEDPLLYYLLNTGYGCYCKPCCEGSDSVTVTGHE